MEAVLVTIHHNHLAHLVHKCSRNVNATTLPLCAGTSSTPRQTGRSLRALGGVSAHGLSQHGTACPEDPGCYIAQWVSTLTAMLSHWLLAAAQSGGGPSVGGWTQGSQWKWLQSNSCPKGGRTDKVTRCLFVRSHQCPAHSCLLSLSLSLIRCSLSFCSLASLGGLQTRFISGPQDLAYGGAQEMCTEWMGMIVVGEV